MKFEFNRPTFFRIDRGLVSSRNVGKIASRNLMNRSSSGWPSWTKTNDVTMAANFPSDSLPLRRDVINCSVKLSTRLEMKSERYFWESKAWSVRREFSRVFELKKRIKIKWINREKDLLFISKSFYWCIELFFKIIRGKNNIVCRRKTSWNEINQIRISFKIVLPSLSS